MKAHVLRATALAAGLLLAGAVPASFAQGSSTAPAIANKAPGGSALLSGIEKSGMDAHVRPQDDLFASMNGQ